MARSGKVNRPHVFGTIDRAQMWLFRVVSGPYSREGTTFARWRAFVAVTHAEFQPKKVLDRAGGI
jgi:hypothetical protein